MANQTLTSLPSLTTPAAGDFFYAVDVSDLTDSSSGSSKKIAYSDLVNTASFVTLNGVDVLTNKDLTSPTNTFPTSLVTLTGTQTLTNKTLTTPKIAQINDTNGNAILVLSPTASAVNRVLITNQSSGSYPSFTADGSDSNIGFDIAPKGTGPVRIYTSAGNTPTFSAAGADSNLNLNLIGKGTGVVTIAGVAAVDVSSAQTLTTKRITKRVQTDTSNATPTPTSDSTDIYTITAQAAAAAFVNPTGTPTQGQTLIVRIKDNATARALTWGTQYRAMGTALPSTTVLSKTLYLGFIFNSTDTKWDLVASAQES